MASLRCSDCQRFFSSFFEHLFLSKFTFSNTFFLVTLTFWVISYFLKYLFWVKFYCFSSFFSEFIFLGYFFDFWSLRTYRVSNGNYLPTYVIVVTVVTAVTVVTVVTVVTEVTVVTKILFFFTKRLFSLKIVAQKLFFTKSFFFKN